LRELYGKPSLLIKGEQNDTWLQDKDYKEDIIIGSRVRYGGHHLW
jgi:hypothetical protein